MTLTPLRLRRALSLSSSLLNHALQKPNLISSITSPSHLTTTAAAAALFSQLTRPFTSTTTLLLSTRRKPFDPETDEIGPDTILFEGCDYNHWLITIDFPKDKNLTREEMIETYVNTAAQVFGSVEEAKKKIYALSTTTYQGFQVECSEETSNKFQNLPGVVFVLPDSYIDPVNKEYGGDKYVNGEIFPRPPPVHYGRRNNRDNRDRRPRDQMSFQQGNGPYNNNYGPPPPQQNYGPPPPQQNYGPPPPQQNYGPPPPQQNYGRPPPPQQGYAPPPQQGYAPPPQQGFAAPPQQGFAAPPQQGFSPPPQQGYAPPPQQGYAPPPQQGYGSPGSGERRGPVPNSNVPGDFGRNPIPPYQGNVSRGEFGNYGQGQRDYPQGNFQGHAPSNENRGFSRDSDYGSPQGENFGKRSGGTQEQQIRQGDDNRGFSRGNN